jgi:transcriptional regulator GlxA family with amidase domain
VLTFGVLLFEGAEELDFAGPWEVFAAAAFLSKNGDRVVTVAEQKRPLRAAKGLTVVPDYAFADAPSLDVLVVPGGRGTRTEVGNDVLIDWIREASQGCRWVTSVCTGALLLHQAGLTSGRRVTTHWSFVEELRARGDVVVLDDVRYVQDGNLVTAAGVSAGIDMALWLVGQIHSPEFAREVQRYIEYAPAPPYG